jgi:type III secretion protein J
METFTRYHKKLRRFLGSALLLFVNVLFLTGCESNEIIANNVDERQANVILVLLASYGIPAQKTVAPSAAVGAGPATISYNISVTPNNSIKAMAILNENGLPRIRGTTLLELFAKQGLMTSEMEETIRYHAGLAEELANTIRKIDGVLDANVQLSFPPPETGIPGVAQPKKIAASVYVKHQGIADDPNSHLVTKIKLLVSGSITGLDINDVTVISDRSRFTNVVVAETTEALMKKEEQFVSIWSVMMTKTSASRFRTILFFLGFGALIFLLLIGWLLWKFYPVLRNRGGFTQLLNPFPITNNKEKGEKEPPPKP